MANVLVVDDEAAISQLLECYLGACGYDVTASRSSLGSLGWLDSASFDVVVLDVALNGAMNGIEVCRAVKSDYRMTSTAVLIISALPDIKSQALAAGADAFISKPFRLDNLRELVDALAKEGPKNLPAQSGSTVKAAIESYLFNPVRGTDIGLHSIGSPGFSDPPSHLVH